MAKPDRKRDTNVPSTIAGFYFQIVLACYEICQDGIKEVGVETDADVVAIDNAGEKSYIESKLHAKKFGRFSEDVKKTIYNFYNGYVKADKIKKMYFVTNVKSQDSDKAFFDAWNTGKQDPDEIMYIKEAVLRKSIAAHVECQDCYKQFCKEMKRTKPKDKDDYEDELVQEVFCGTGCYPYGRYAVENDECTYPEFVQRLQFCFLNKKKKDLLEEIEKKTKDKIKADYKILRENSTHQDLTDQGADEVFCMLVKLFFDCIVENSQKKTKRTIWVEKYRSCLSAYRNNEIASEEMHILKQCLENLSFDEENMLDGLDLEKAEDKAFFKCYSAVKEVFVGKLCEEGKVDFMYPYLLRDEMKGQIREIQLTMTELIRVLTVILYREKMSVDDVELFFSRGLNNNVRIVKKLLCCYKHVYGKTSTKDIVRKLVDEIPVLSENRSIQTMVLEANYLKGGQPCKLGELRAEAYNISQVDSNYEDFLFLSGLNYKCTDCIIWDEGEYSDFWRGGGGLCRKL